MDKMISGKILIRAITQLLILGVNMVVLPLLATGCASRHSHSDLAETQWVFPCVISASSRRNCCAEGVVPSQ